MSLHIWRINLSSRQGWPIICATFNIILRTYLLLSIHNEVSLFGILNAPLSTTWWFFILISNVVHSSSMLVLTIFELDKRFKFCSLFAIMPIWILICLTFINICQIFNLIIVNIWSINWVLSFRILCVEMNVLFWNFQNIYALYIPYRWLLAFYIGDLRKLISSIIFYVFVI